MRSRLASQEWARYRAISENIGLLEADFDRFSYETHFHDTYAVGVTLRGVQRFHCRGATHDSLPGDVMVIPPGEAHDGASGARGGYAYRMFYVSAPTLAEVAADARESASAAVALRRTSVLRAPSLARHVNAAWQAMKAGVDLLAADELFTRAFAPIVGGTRGSEKMVPARNAALLNRVRDYLVENRLRCVTMNELAAVASMSRFRLTRQFQRAFGLSLHAYHLQLRLHEAKHRLRGGQPISAVALDLGFVDQSHLHRRFKGAFGVTPGAWRALHLRPIR